VASARGQRIGIWIIAIVMTVGTVGSFIVIILSNNNAKVDEARKTLLTNEYNQEVKDYQAKVDAQTAALSTQYYDTFSPYASRVGTFDKDNSSTLIKNDLVVGTGDTITQTSTYAAYYIGWLPDGTIFDQSIDSGKLKAPLTVTANAGVIDGWATGVVGMKVGGVRELTIPGPQAYPSGQPSQNGSVEIPAESPLKFVIMIIPKPDTIPQPQPSAELLKLYGQ
jgi:FKBP-type peptidyl-prolyl cis-trans isomerase